MINFYKHYNQPELLQCYSLYGEFLNMSRYQNWWVVGTAPEWSDVIHIIIRSSSLSYMYAKYIIKKRFPEGEPAIMKDSYNAFWYVKSVLKCRWLEAEERNVFGGGYRWHLYRELFNI